MTVKDFIKSIKKTFGEDVEFQATSKEGKIFRSTGYAKIESDIRRGRGTRKKANW
jgi:hypothetical protein